MNLGHQATHLDPLPTAGGALSQAGLSQNQHLCSGCSPVYTVTGEYVLNNCEQELDPHTQVEYNIHHKECLSQFWLL